MPMDAYSPCPGGSGKKIKFCCPDLLADHQKIERMLSGKQFQAALNHVERLEEKHPGRACLLAHRCLLLYLLDRTDELEAAAATFLQKHPANPIALAETAIIVARKQGGRAALPWLQRTMEAVETAMPMRVWQMLVIVGQTLAEEGEFLAARAVLDHALFFQPDDAELIEAIRQLLGTRSLPPWFKDERFLASCPNDAPWKADFDEALQLARRGRWAMAERRFLAIASQAGEQPAVWRNVAMVRGWLADRQGCVKALWKYSRLDVPLEDAVEAAAKAMLLSDDPLGDQADLLSLTYPIVDVEQFQTAIASAEQFRDVTKDMASIVPDETPPPRAIYLLDEPDLRGSGGSTDPESRPRVICSAWFYGKETDREARLKLFPIVANEEQAVVRLLGHVLFGVLGPLAERNVVGRRSRTRELIVNTGFSVSETTDRISLSNNQRDCEDVLFQKWLDGPLGVLDGKTPLEAAKEAKYHVPLLAAILLMEFWTQGHGFEIDFNRLRARLGLPTLDPIDPDQVEIARLPVGRLSRVMAEKLPQAELRTLLRIASVFKYVPAIRKLGRALLDHPDSTNLAERMSILSFLARAEVKFDRALAYIDEGRKLAESNGESSASWDLMELSVQLARGLPDEVARLFEHLQKEHIHEPGVAAALSNFLVQIGALTPDGFVVEESPAPSPVEPSLAGSNPQDAESGKLWTPGGESGEGGKPKLWIPGMD